MKIKALAKVGATVSKVTGKAGLKIRKYSPEILLAAGIVGVVGTVVLACRSTLKVNEVLDTHDETKEMIESSAATFTDNDKEKDLVILKIQTATKLAKLYAPSVALGAFSVGCLITSRNITHKRYLAVVSAYNALSEAFKQYRKRVVDEYGEKLDKHFRYGTVYNTITETEVDEDGKKVKKKVDTEETSIKIPSETAVYFDESNPNWDANPEYSMMFLRAQQNWLNDRLHTVGHVFLNEVYDALGFPHTQQGCVIGWVDGLGDNFIDIGLYDQHKDNVRAFVNGNENCILLDFNHDGVIWDKV